MEQTLFLAQFLGLFSVILAAAVLLRRKLVVHVVGEFLKNRTLAFVVGIAEVAGGLLLVLSHSTWGDTLETVISLFGWLLLLEGIFYLFVDKKALRDFIKVLDNVKAYYFFATLYLILGLYLVYVGFGLGT